MYCFAHTNHDIPLDFSFFLKKRFCPVEKCGVTPHWLSRGSLTLNNCNNIVQKDFTPEKYEYCLL